MTGRRRRNTHRPIWLSVAGGLDRLETTMTSILAMIATLFRALFGRSRGGTR
jgi:hypothetical protein